MPHFGLDVLTIVFASLTFLRIMLVLLAGVGSSSPEIANRWLPPFERVIAISSLGFLVWGFTPYFRQREFIGNVLLGVNTALAFLFYFLGVWVWDGVGDFNQNRMLEGFFIVWQAALVLFGVINSATQLDDENEPFLCSGWGPCLLDI